MPPRAMITLLFSSRGSIGAGQCRDSRRGPRQADAFGFAQSAAAARRPAPARPRARRRAGARAGRDSRRLRPRRRRGEGRVRGPVRPAAGSLQSQQLGTGHAVLQALPSIPDDHQVLVLLGDVPLVSTRTLQRLVNDSADGDLALLDRGRRRPDRLWPRDSRRARRGRANRRGQGRDRRRAARERDQHRPHGVRGRLAARASSRSSTTTTRRASTT